MESSGANFTVEKIRLWSIIKYLLSLLILSSGIIVIPQLMNIWRYFIFLLVVIILITPSLWKKQVEKIIRKEVIDYNSGMKISKKSIYAKIVGIKSNESYRYFIYKSSKRRDLNSMREIYSKYIFDVISGTIGMTFTIALIIKYTFGHYFSNIFSMLLAIIFVLNISPLFMGFLIPTLWTLRDIDIRQVDDENNIINLGEQMRQGVFRKIIGFAGFFTGISFFIDLGDEFWDKIPIATNTIQIFLLSTFYLFVFSISIGGSAILISLIYLSKYHSEIVNRFRSTKELQKTLEIV